MLPKCDRKPHPGAHGFTLVELLIAFAILAVIATAIGQSLRVGGLIWSRTRGHEDVEQIRIVQQTLRRYMEQARPSTGRTDVPSPGLTGTPRSMTFIAPLMIGGQSDGLHEVQVHADATAQGPALLMSWRIDRPSRRGRLEPRTSHTLLSEIEDVLFEYAAPSPDGGTPDWRPTWQDQKHLPVIRIHVSFPENDSRLWPPLTIHPPITMDARCNYDPISQRCRGE